MLVMIFEDQRTIAKFPTISEDHPGYLTCYQYYFSFIRIIGINHPLVSLTVILLYLLD